MSYNNENIPPMPQTPPPVPTPPKRGVGRKVLAVIIPVLAFIIGAGIATAGASTAPAEVAEPEVRTETVTETETVEVETTPDACVDALNAADDLTEYFGEAIVSAADSVGYAGTFDSDALDAETKKLEELTPKIEDARAEYDLASIECRASN